MHYLGSGMMSLERLAIFVTVARTLSFTRAARALGLPTTNVSRRVAELEAMLGVRLFERSTRRVRLTAEGQDLFARTDASIDALQSVLGSRPEPGGAIRVTAPPLAARTTVGPALLGFMERRTDVRIELVATNAPLDFIRDGIDLAFRLGPLEDSDLIVRPLWPVHYALCASDALLHRHGLTASMPLETLLDLPCVSTGQAWSFDRQPPVTPRRVACVIDELELAAMAVGCGLGVGYLPRDLARQHARIIEVDDLHARGRTMNAVYPARRLLPRRVRDLIDHMAASGPRPAGDVEG